MKLRLRLKNNKEFLCKDISEIKIDGVLYLKRDCKTSVDVQNFYFFMKTNINNITYIKERKTKNKYYFKNEILHNVYGPAFIPYGRGEYYYLNDELLLKKDWENHPGRKNYLRKLKLKKIINENI